MLDWATAKSELIAALGAEHVRDDAETIARYARTTLPATTTPRSIVYPFDTAQVQQVVRIAKRCGLSLYPISRGRNWGYGDRTAPSDGQIVVDLARMNQIYEVNETLCYAVIEPGVTQAQLYQYLRQNFPNLWMDATGAGPESSVLGNALDRGFGHTPVGDHYHQTGALEAVLADGRILRTGYGAFAGAQATHAYPYGVGPVLDGLFSQSNFGIVTRATVGLMPRPESFSAFFVSTPDASKLADLVDRLTPLRLQGLLRSAVHIANDVRVFSSRIAYPYDRTGGRTPIPPEVRSAIVRELDIGAWNVSGGIYGTGGAGGTVAAIKRAIRTAMRGYRVIFLGDRMLATAQRALPRLKKLGFAAKAAELLPIIEPAYGLLKGVPSDEFLKGVLWMKSNRASASLDPLDHQVGLVWASPTAPATGEHACRIRDIMEPIYHKHGFDFLITMTLVTSRALCCVSNFTFDRNDAAQTQRAQDCYSELMAALLKEGYPPYRTGPGGYAKLHEAAPDFFDTCAKLRSALDPQGIIAPGRYVP
ncbi:MAG: FAD-binding oxidoreductase [Phycisphaeraceae bacterium]|nr:FAD-binding oxidoreductase [Phycisphaeraceae bacterium]